MSCLYNIFHIYGKMLIMEKECFYRVIPNTISVSPKVKILEKIKPWG